ncbi:MAG: RecQ family ATP-dependent DNA helicase [bacterium]
MPDLIKLLATHYGFSSFRPGQEEIVQSILSGRDTLALMPTGGGKSLCFQLPALALPGTTVVISPLIALMKDQVDALKVRGIAASFINSSLPADEIDRRIQDVLAGKIKLLYLAPERLATGFTEQLRKISISLVAIDEAHCVSTWGHDFRPDYLEIEKHISQLAKRPILATFTATATPEVKQDIIKRLGLQNPQTFVRGFDRPNLRFFTRAYLSDYERQEELARLVRSMKGSGIVYCGTRDKTEELARYLQENGINALPYHAGMKTEERTRVQEQFMRDDVPVITATIAFGMGVDKPDVRFVIHAHMPASLENYYQEAGRAGRDGETAYCVLLHSGQDSALHEFFIEKNYEESLDRGKPMQEATVVRVIKFEKLKKIQEYATTRACRRKLILDYFGDGSSLKQDNCKGCDHCLDYQWEGGEEADEPGRDSDDVISCSSAGYDDELSDTVMQSVTLYRRGLSVDEIRRARGLSISTIHGHLMKWYLAGGELDTSQFLPHDKERIILKAIAECDDPARLGSIKEKCPDSITYDDIRWAIAKMKKIKL